MPISTKILLLPALLLVFGCQDASQSDDTENRDTRENAASEQEAPPPGPTQRELVPNPEKYAHDGYNETPDADKPKFMPDTKVGQITLRSQENVEAYLQSPWERLVEPNNDYPNTSVRSSDGDQVLTAVFYPGGVKNKYSAFRVRYAHTNDKDHPKITEQVFATENGVKLGMTMGDLQALKGEPHDISADQHASLHYRITDENHPSDILNQHNMPSYFATYTFANGYLIEYQFGFDYP